MFERLTFWIDAFLGAMAPNVHGPCIACGGVASPDCPGLCPDHYPNHDMNVGVVDMIIGIDQARTLFPTAPGLVEGASYSLTDLDDLVMFLHDGTPMVLAPSKQGHSWLTWDEYNEQHGTEWWLPEDGSDENEDPDVSS